MNCMMPICTLCATLALMAHAACVQVLQGGVSPYRHVLVRDFRTVKDGKVVNFNIGTAAHCPGTLAALMKRWPEAKFSVWADAPLVPELAALMARRFPSVAIYTGDKEPETDADLLLVSSGSGIAGSVRRSIEVWRSSRADRPVAAYAIGYSSSLRSLISTFDFCFFRDKEALARAIPQSSNPPIPQSKATLYGFAPDAVFDFDAADDAGAVALLAEHGLEPGKFVCAIPGHRFTPWWEFSGGKADAKRAAKNAKHEISDNAVVCAAIIEAVRNHGMKALLCAEQRTELPLASRALYDQLPPDVQTRCVVLHRFWSPDLALGVYRQSRCVFGIEMHSQVMALGNGVPACVFRHSGFGTKSSMFKDVGAGEWLLDIDEPEAARKAAAMVGGILSDPAAAAAKCRAARAAIDRAADAALARVSGDERLSTNNERLTTDTGVAIGENLLSNPIFESDQQVTPAFWHVAVKGASYEWDATGGPDASPALRFRAETNGTFSVRQTGLRLYAPGRYRISCQVKARDFRAKSVGFQLAEPGWRHPVGLKIAPGTYGWRRVEKVLEIDRPTKDGTWFAVFYADRCAGTIEVTDVQVSPVDAETARRTRFSKEAEIREAPRLVPMKPILALIPADDRRVFFSFFGRLREGVADDYEVILEADGKTSRAPLRCGPPRTACPTGEMFPVPLPDGAQEGRFTASVVRRGAGQPIFRREYPYRVMSLPAKVTKGRRLNNLVEELENRTLSVGASVSIPLAFARDVWLYISAEAEMVTLDGKELCGLRYPAHETFREVPAGMHVLAVSGAKGGALIVRRIPETLDYQTAAGDFQRTRVFPSVTSLNGIRIAKEDQTLFRETGHLHIGSVGMTDFASRTDLEARLNGCAAMADPFCSGVTCDELNPWSARKMSELAETYWAYQLPADKRIYSWVVGKPFFTATDHDAVSAILNVGGGKGRLLNEFYCRTRATEEEARAHVRDWLIGNLRAWERFSPVLRHGYAPIFGAYTEMRYGSTVSPHCDVDYRYYLDLQFNLLANDPAFIDIPCTGVWGTNYSDAELKGWTFHLLRHYCVEGQRTMLSGAFGLRYRPGHLKNGDFAERLDGWTAAGDVKISRVEGFGLESELRGGKNMPPIGDTFAELRGGGASITQKATGLTPGRDYELTFMTFSPEDARAHRKTDRPVRIEVKIKGARVGAEGVFSKARRRPKTPQGATVTDNRVVFTAESSEAEIVFCIGSDEAVGINSIGLRRAIELAPSNCCGQI